MYLNLFRFSCFLTTCEEAFLICVMWVEPTFHLCFDPGVDVALLVPHRRAGTKGAAGGTRVWSLTSAGSRPEIKVSVDLRCFEVSAETPPPLQSGRGLARATEDTEAQV